MSRRVLGLAIALCATLAPSAQAGQPRPDRMTLRLSDVDPGYVRSSNSECGFAIGGEGLPKILTRLFLQYPHIGCETELLDAWRPGPVPRPARIASTAFVFHGPDGPAAELEHPRRVVSAVTGLPDEWLVPIKMPVPLGDESFAFATNVAAKDVGRPIVVTWRSGRVLAVLDVASDTDEPFEQAALQLAALQQRHVVAPTPLTPADKDDVEVPLDDPRLGVDVSWLGRQLGPTNHDLPTLSLNSAGGAPEPLGELRLMYGVERFSADVDLYLWHRSAWRRHARTRFGRLIWHERCVRVTRVPVNGGVAVIYAGHVRRQTRCGHRPPDRFLAHVFLGHVIVSVNPALCWTCRAWGGPYDSLAGMRAVVRALRPRPPTFGD